MHWLLDVHFGEDDCRIHDRTIQRNLNMLRKYALSLIQHYKKRENSTRPISKIMFACLLDCAMISTVLQN